MKVYLLLAVLIVSCSTLKKDQVIDALVYGNKKVASKLKGFKRNKINNIKLEDILAVSKKMKSQKMKDYHQLLEKSENISLYPRDYEFVICMKWSGNYICDLSECGPVDYFEKRPMEREASDLRCENNTRI